MSNTIPGNRSVLQNFYQKMRTGQFAGVSEHPVLSAARQLIAVGLQLPLLDAEGNVNFFVGVINATPVELPDPFFHLQNKKKLALINTRFSNLSVHRAPIELKIG